MKNDLAKVNARIRRLGLTPRQQRINALWKRFRGQQHDHKKINWNGEEILDPIDAETYGSQVFTPGGMIRIGDDFPLSLRKPVVQYALPAVIVNKFSDLLFGTGKTPQVQVNDDNKTEDWLRTALDVGLFWSTMMEARKYGGATGTTIISFGFKDGKPIFESHLPTWCEPIFVERGSFDLLSLDIRYIFQKDIENTYTGNVDQVAYWYRRNINQQTDTLYQEVAVKEGDEPAWDTLIERQTTHGFGFCPAVWVQNLPLADSVDGDPDCSNTVLALSDDIDVLESQAFSGTSKNADPTVILNLEKGQLSELRKGSDHSLQLGASDQARYMEMSGAGIRMALDLSEHLKKQALEVAQCILENPSDVSKTATEVRRSTQSMHSKCDALRMQYGEFAIKKLAIMLLKAARSIENKIIIIEDGTVQRSKVILPPNIIGEEKIPKEIGNGEFIELQWPSYVEPTSSDTIQVTSAASSALNAGLIDLRNAVQYIASYFGISDVSSMLDNIQKEKKIKEAELHASMLGV
jgi:hypothetical protein